VRDGLSVSLRFSLRQHSRPQQGRVAAVVRVLDFENAIAGDPLLDLAKAVYYFTPEDEAKRVALFTGYGPIERGDLQDTLALYHCYRTIELWSWFAQIGNHQPLAKLTRALEQFR
jgi:aminoglycoside phosphotransferase (APT) family kinase protein